MATAKGYKTKKIGKNKYGLHMLKAKEAFSYGLKLRTLLPVSGSFFDSQTSNALDGMKFSQMAETFVMSMDSLEIEDILEDVVYSNLDLNGQDVDVDDHFQGELGELIDVIAWALEVNFKSLFLGSTFLSKMYSKLKEMGLIPTRTAPVEEVEVVEEIEEELEKE